MPNLATAVLMTAIIIFLLIACVFVYLTTPNKWRIYDLPAVYCHRGYFDNEEIPENSLPAFEKSAEKGLAIERDVRPTRDREIVVFHDLSKADYEKIAALRLDELREPLKEKGISLSYDGAALSAIAAKAFGNKGGARDLVRVIRKDIEDRVCELMVANADRKLSGIAVSAKDGEITVAESERTPELTE